MTPTNELRFVERPITKPVPNQPTLCIKTTIPVFQQKWVGTEFDLITGKPVEEWRDVPCVKEEA